MWAGHTTLPAAHTGQQWGLSYALYSEWWLIWRASTCELEHADIDTSTVGPSVRPNQCLYLSDHTAKSANNKGLLSPLVVKHWHVKPATIIFNQAVYGQTTQVQCSSNTVGSLSLLAGALGERHYYHRGDVLAVSRLCLMADMMCGGDTNSVLLCAHKQDKQINTSYLTWEKNGEGGKRKKF